MQTQALEFLSPGFSPGLIPASWVTLGQLPNLSNPRHPAFRRVEGFRDGECEVRSACLCLAQSDGSVLLTWGRAESPC